MNAESPTISDDRHARAQEPVWLPIPGYEHYEASDEGRIRSLDRTLPFQCRWGQMTTRFYSGKVLAKKIKPNGYGQFYTCYRMPENRYVQGNRLVALTFLGPPPSPKHEAAHLNGDSLDDRPANLAWKTAVENAADKVLHGTASIGSKNGQALLSEADIPIIFEEYAAGSIYQVLGDKFGVSASVISQIIRRENWQHVPVCPDIVVAAQAMAKFNIAKAAGWNRGGRA